MEYSKDWYSFNSIDENDLNSAFGQITNWFRANSLSLNLSKTYFKKFSSKNLNSLDVNIKHANNFIPKVNDIKFLRLTINDTLSWKTQVDITLPKLCSACFAMRSVKPYVSQQMLKVIYYSYFHSIMSHSIIFWGHSASSIKFSDCRRE